MTRPTRQQARDTASRVRLGGLLLVGLVVVGVLVVVVVVHGLDPHGRRWRPRLGAGSSRAASPDRKKLDRTCPSLYQNPCRITSPGPLPVRRDYAPVRQSVRRPRLARLPPPGQPRSG